MHRLFVGNLSRAVSRQLSATPFVLYCPSLVWQVMILSTFLFPHIPIIIAEKSLGQ